MQITALELTDYRNYCRAAAEFCPGLNLFYGANAQGKTNLIEAIYYLSLGRAYRPVRDEQLIRWGQDKFCIKAEVRGLQGQVNLTAAYHKEGRPPKIITAGGLRLTKAEELSGLFTSVLFSPESIAVIKGAPQERRAFLDYDISQVSSGYARDLRRYRRLLAQRNRLLKNLQGQRPGDSQKAQLEPWDQQLVEYGAKIIQKRLLVLEKLNPLTRLIQRKLTGGQENIELSYLFYGGVYGGRREAETIAEDLRQVREEHLREDLRLGVTQWGPQRDDLEILLNGTDLKRFGSQGQQRTAVLALKLAELEFFRGETGEFPVLLLDDVLSELDESRRDQLLAFIDEKAIQCFITATEKSSLRGPKKRQSRSFLIKAGKIEKK